MNNPWIKAILSFIGIILVLILLTSCGYPSQPAEDLGSYEEELQLLDEHIFSYMDRESLDVYSPTGYLVMVDTNTGSVAGYIRNPYGGYTRVWAQTAIIGKDLTPGSYSIQWRLDGFTYKNSEVFNSCWFEKYTIATSDSPQSDLYTGGVYVKTENAKWIFENCQNTTPIVVFESTYSPFNVM